MLNCSKCNFQLDDDALFCPNCGQAVEKEKLSESVHGVVEIFCTFCGSKKVEDKQLCPNCGHSAQDSHMTTLPKSKKAHSLRNIIVTITVFALLGIGVSAEPRCHSVAVLICQ